MTEALSNDDRWMWVLAPLLFGSVLLTACERAQMGDPWASGSQYEQERSRSPETAEQLRHRVMYNQIDR